MAQLGFRRRRDQFSLALLFALFALLPLTVVFGHRGLAPWLLLASIPAFLRGDFWLVAFGAIFDRMTPREPFFAAFISILVFCGWIFLSGFWSPRAMPSLALWVLGPVIIGGCAIWFSVRINRIWAWRIAVGYAAAIVVGMGVLAFEGMTQGALRALLPPASPDPAKDIVALGRGVTALAPALIPAGIIAAAIWSRYTALFVIALGVAAAILNEVTANAVALTIGLLAALVTFKAPRFTIRMVSYLAIVALLAAPLAAFAPVDALLRIGADLGAPSSWLHRIVIWQASAAEIWRGLPFGMGADYARIWTETAPYVAVPGAQAPLPVVSNHPHNFFLQTWLELGFVGVVSLAGFFYFGAKAFLSANMQSPIIAAAVGAFCAILVSMMVEASMWQVWRLAAMALAGMGVGLAHSLHMNWSRVQ